jgi:hypothetical protein
MNYNLIKDFGWFVVAIVLSAKACQWIAPYLWRERNSKQEDIEFHMRKLEQYRIKQLYLNMTRRDALRVRMTNVAILIASLCLVGYLTLHAAPVISGTVILVYGIYVVAGYITCELAGVPPTKEMAGLNWKSRMTVRLYYAWFWPSTLAKAMARKN